MKKMAERAGPSVAASDARGTTLALLTARVPGATVCPSQVARALVARGSGTRALDWRHMMPAVHAAIDQLVIEGLVRLSWKGEMLTRRSGPYRIGR
jgi:hypothetical protein